MRKAWLIFSGVIVGLTMFVAALSMIHHDATVFLLVSCGAGLGWLVGVAAAMALVRPSRYRVFVKSGDLGEVRLTIETFWDAIEAGKVPLDAEDFDDQLHEAKSAATHKATALTVAGQR